MFLDEAAKRAERARSQWRKEEAEQAGKRDCRGQSSWLCVPNSRWSSTRAAEFTGVCAGNAKERRETMAENADGKQEKSGGSSMMGGLAARCGRWRCQPETRLSACAAAAAAATEAATEAAKWHLRIQHLNGRQSGKPPRQTRMISPVRQTDRTDGTAGTAAGK